MQNATTVGARVDERSAGSLRTAALTLALAAVAIAGAGTTVLVTTSGGSGPGDTPQNAHPVRGWNTPAVQVPVRVYSPPAPVRGRAVQPQVRVYSAAAPVRGRAVRLP
jgi:hypothetical protein